MMGDKSAASKQQSGDRKALAADLSAKARALEDAALDLASSSSEMGDICASIAALHRNGIGNASGLADVCKTLAREMATASAPIIEEMKRYAVAIADGSMEMRPFSSALPPA